MFENMEIGFNVDGLNKEKNLFDVEYEVEMTRKMFEKDLGKGIDAALNGFGLDKKQHLDNNKM